jgi:hypothetical protein
MTSELVLGTLCLPVPDGWRVDRWEAEGDSGEAVLVFDLGRDEKIGLPLAKTTPRFMGSALIELKCHDAPVDLKAFVADRIALFEKAQPSCRSILDSEIVVAGQDGLMREHLFAGPGRLLYRQKLVYAAAGTATYVLSTTHLAGSSFDLAREAFDALISNIRWSGKN